MRSRLEDRLSKRTLAFVIALAAFAPAAFAPAAHAGDDAMTFHEAKQLAGERGVPVVVDFFTDWCGFCKQFDAAKANPESGIEAALSDFVFVSINAEKGEGIELAKRFSVRGFPTYAVVTSAGDLVESWSGYGGPDHFLSALEAATTDLTPFEQKLARFEATPRASDAEAIARVRGATGQFDEAIELLARARELGSSSDVGPDILQYSFGKLRTDPAYGLDGFLEAATAEAERDDAGAETVMTAAAMVSTIGKQFGQPDAGHGLLSLALEAIERDPGAGSEGLRNLIEIEGYLKVRKDADAAVAAKRRSMPEGWMDDANQLNAFAWWCFENEIHLEEAEELARRGIELAESGKPKAALLDTAAEICNLRGDCRDAVTLIEQAIAEDPTSDWYEQQLERFQKNLASME